MSQVDEVSDMLSSGSVALLGEGSEKQQWPFQALSLAERYPPALALVLDDSVPPHMSLISFNLLPPHWSLEGVSLSKTMLQAL